MLEGAKKEEQFLPCRLPVKMKLKRHFHPSITFLQLPRTEKKEEKKPLFVLVGILCLHVCWNCGPTTFTRVIENSMNFFSIFCRRFRLL